MNFDQTFDSISLSSWSFSICAVENLLRYALHPLTWHSFYYARSLSLSAGWLAHFLSLTYLFISFFFDSKLWPIPRKFQFISRCLNHFSWFWHFISKHRRIPSSILKWKFKDNKLSLKSDTCIPNILNWRMNLNDLRSSPVIFFTFLFSFPFAVENNDFYF